MFTLVRTLNNKVKQSLKQKQKLSLNLTLNLQKQIELLSLSGYEIRSRLDNLIEEFCRESENKKIKYFRDEVRLDRYRKAIDPDSTNFLIDKEENLQESLLEQLTICPLKEYEILIGEVIIDSILDNGRLDPELESEDIKRIVKEDFDLEITDIKIESILNLIQNFDPPGCAYRSIDESLKVQVDNLDLDETTQKKVINSLTSLVNQKILKEDLSSEIKTHIDKLSLNLGLNFGNTNHLYARPDLIGFCQKNLWQVSLNDDFLNQSLIEELKNEIESSGHNRIIEAKSFLRGLERRQQTLYLVGQYILTKQSEYLNETSYKKPITNKEIARTLEISESTVSRIVRNKYVQLPNKLILLKELLQKKVNKNAEGKDITPRELKDYISSLISKEDPKQPLSDENLRNLLSSKHLINVARRTISKYREEAGIGSTRERKVH